MSTLSFFLRVLSDVHIYPGYTYDYANALNDFQNYVGGNANLEAYYLVGDIIHYASATNYDLSGATFGRYYGGGGWNAIGNHEYMGPYDSGTDKALFLSKNKRTDLYRTNFHHGVPCIILGSESDLGWYADISATQRSWLDNQLELYTDYSHPTFVFMHQHTRDTNCEAALDAILSSYPGVFLFYGHLHCDLTSGNIENFNNNKGYYEVHTASTCYVADNYNKSQGLQVEVWDDHVQIRGRDFNNHSWISSFQHRVDYPFPEPPAPGPYHPQPVPEDVTFAATLNGSVDSPGVELALGGLTGYDLVDVIRKDQDQVYGTSTPVRSLKSRATGGATSLNVVDYEAPIGLPLTYELTCTDLAPASTHTETATVTIPAPSGDPAPAWIKCVTNPLLSKRVDLSNLNETGYEATVLLKAHVLGRANYVVTTDYPSGKAGTFVVGTYPGSTASLLELERVLKSAQVLLLQTADWTLGDYKDFYFVVEKVDRVRVGNPRASNQSLYTLAVSYTEVDPPDFEVESGSLATLGKLKTAQLTLGAAKAAYPTWADCADALEG